MDHEVQTLLPRQCWKTLYFCDLKENKKIFNIVSGGGGGGGGGGKRGDLVQ